jgi:hypothetical protein
MRICIRILALGAALRGGMMLAADAAQRPFATSSR